MVEPLPTLEETESSRSTFQVLSADFLRRRPHDFGRLVVQTLEKRLTRNRKSIGAKRERLATVKSHLKSIGKDDSDQLKNNYFAEM
jgi:hypothetical protein